MKTIFESCWWPTKAHPGFLTQKSALGPAVGFEQALGGCAHWLFGDQKVSRDKTLGVLHPLWLTDGWRKWSCVLKRTSEEMKAEKASYGLS